MTSSKNISPRIEEILKSSGISNPSLHEDLADDIKYALKSCYEECTTESIPSDTSLTLIEAVLDKIWESLNIGCWKDIPDYLRETYGYASFLKVLLLLRSVHGEGDTNFDEKLRGIVQVADRGLLLGNSHRKNLSNIASSLCDIIQIESEPFVNVKITYENQNLSPKNERLKISTLESVERPSLTSFVKNHFEPQIPLKLTKCIEHWPALENWSNIAYIIKKVGPRLVPVEIGRSYTSHEWSQKLMTVENFIRDFVLPSQPKRIGYLAQHQLFNQIPELLDDVRIPDYCTFTESENEDSVDVNAWFGPANTVSDLHYDPKHNFLVQVVGKKRVLLVHPKNSENVYPRDDTLLFNTAMIDPENPDFENFPKFEDTEVIECYLDEGDMLYIPPKWWHHVRSLSISFSVSFWWGSSETTKDLSTIRTLQSGGALASQVGCV